MKNDHTRYTNNRTQNTRSSRQRTAGAHTDNTRRSSQPSNSKGRSVQNSAGARRSVQSSAAKTAHPSGKSRASKSGQTVRSRQSGGRLSAVSRGRDNSEMKLLIMIILAVVVVIAVIGGTIKERGKAAGQAASESVGESALDGNTAESLQGTATDISIGDDEVTVAIESLIRQYRAACASADVETIAKLYNVSQLPNETTFMAVSSIIAGYQNTQCYIREGLDDVSRVVFIYDDLKLADYDTLVPNLSYVYVRAAADGSFYIYPGIYNEELMSYEYEEEILDHIDSLESDIEIAELIKDVNQKFSDTCDANKDIKEFIDQLIAADSESKSEKKAETEAETKEETTADTNLSNESETADSESIDETLDSMGLESETAAIESETESN